MSMIIGGLALVLICYAFVTIISRCMVVFLGDGSIFSKTLAMTIVALILFSPLIYGAVKETANHHNERISQQ